MLLYAANDGSELEAGSTVIQTVKTIDSVLDLSEKVRSQITHVATSCFWHSMVGVDDKGRPTTQVLTWADNRSRDHVKVLRQKLDETWVHQLTGARFHSSFWPAKLLWLKASQPDAFSRTAMWLSLSDYIAMQLCDTSTTSTSMASATGILDIRECIWHQPLLKALKIRQSQLPRIADSAETFRLNRKYSKRWPQLADASWFPAIGDGAASNIGSGCMTESCAALMVGTSGAMRVAYRGNPPKAIPPGLWCYRVDDKRVILGGALSDGGGLYAWLKKTLSNDLSDKAINDQLKRRRPGAHGLTVMPFFFGERSTGYHENASGSILGLSARHDTIDILQAAMESVAFRFAEIADQLRDVVEIDRIVASGGSLRAFPVWIEIIADVLSRNIHLVDVAEASLHGVVLLALETIGNIENIDTVSSNSSNIFVPDMKNHAVYSAARARHQYFYNLIINKL